MPYISLPEWGGNFLIDTGSTRSLIKPSFIQDLASKVIEKQFQIKTTHGTSEHKGIINLKVIPLGDEFVHEFLLYDFDPKYAGMIGIDLIRKLNAVINLNKCELITPNRTLPISIDYPERVLEIDPLSENLITCVTEKADGDYFVPEIGSNRAIVNCALISVKDGKYRIGVTNLSTEPCKVKNNFDEHLKSVPDEIKPVESFLETVEMNCLENDKLLIRMDHMNTEEKTKILKLTHEFKDIFHSEKEKLTFTHTVKHKLRLTDDTPVYVRNYRKPPHQQKEIDNQVNELLDNGIIQGSNSPWSCPVHIVPKKPDASGKVKWRMVIDYRQLNAKTIEDKYPLPNIEEILDKLGRAQYFSTIDLASGYHQIEMHPEDVEKTAFSTNHGHWEFLRMPFGLRNAPATFQRLMDLILRDLLYNTCLVYLDDIIVYSTSLEEHIEKLRNVFQRLREHNLKVQPLKSEFLKKHVEYLGHELTPNGVTPNQRKVQDILNFPVPKTEKEIRSFLGLTGYYRRFIDNYAKITKPLTKCLKKKAKIIINDDFIKAVDKLKELITNEPILKYPDFEQPFILTTDASDFALGAVLSQNEENIEKPVAYASRTLSNTETKYSTTEKELLAIVWACKHFRPYLYGRKFVIYTDHKPLTWLMSLKDPNSRLTRWRLKLAEYNFEIKYKQGSINSNADALSRIKINFTEDDSIVPQIGSVIINQPEVENAETQTQHSQEDNLHPGIPIINDVINKKAHQIYFKLHNRLDSVIEKSEDGNKIIEVSLYTSQRPANALRKFIKEHMKPGIQYYGFFYAEELYKDMVKILTKEFNSNIRLTRCTEIVEKVTDKDRQIEIIKDYHEGQTNHRGITETMMHISRKYWWKNIMSDIRYFVNNCSICKAGKYERHPNKPPMLLPPIAMRPLTHIFCDVVEIEGKQYLSIVDGFSRFAVAKRLKDKNSSTVTSKILSFFSQYGVPLEITTDSGKEFALLKELVKLYNIKVNFTTPYNPCSHGIVERFHSTLREHCRLLTEQHKNKLPHEDKMKLAVLAYNNSIQSDTKLTPHEILFGHIETVPLFNFLHDSQLLNSLLSKHRDHLQIVYDYIYKTKRDDQIKRTDAYNKDTELPPPQVETHEKLPKTNKQANVFCTRRKTYIRDVKAPKVYLDNRGKRRAANILRPIPVVTEPSASQAVPSTSSNY